MYLSKWLRSPIRPTYHVHIWKMFSLSFCSVCYCCSNKMFICYLIYLLLLRCHPPHPCLACYYCGNRRKVLEQYKSDGLDLMGPVKPTLALCVFGVFVLVYFSLWKGVRSAGKVVWVTALAPYVVLIILLIRGVSLPGADEGIKYYLTPEWHKLKNSRVSIGT